MWGRFALYLMPDGILATSNAMPNLTVLRIAYFVSQLVQCVMIPVSSVYRHAPGKNP
jgi:hypothetical protein